MKIKAILVWVKLFGLINVIHCSKRNSIFNHVSTYDSMKCTNPLFEHNVAVEMSCTSICLGRTDCVGVFYSRSTTLCTGCGHFNTDHLAGSTADTKYLYNSAGAVTWKTFNGSSYCVHSNPVKFAEAKAFCTVNLGGYLVHFDNSDEVDFVNDLADTAGVGYYSIGLEYNTTDNKFKWGDDNTEPTFTDFATEENDEPNGYPVEKCVAAWGEFGKKWADYTCEDPFSFVCEKGTIYGQFID